MGQRRVPTIDDGRIRSFLQSLPVKAELRGKALAVLSPPEFEGETEVDGDAFVRGTVRDGDAYSVVIRDSGRFVDATCNCKAKRNCEHIVALGVTYLNASATRSKAQANERAQSLPRWMDDETKEFAARLCQKQGRPLSSDEIELLRVITDVHRDAHRAGRFDQRHVYALGMVDYIANVQASLPTLPTSLSNFVATLFANVQLAGKRPRFDWFAETELEPIRLQIKRRRLAATSQISRKSMAFEVDRIARNGAAVELEVRLRLTRDFAVVEIREHPTNPFKAASSSTIWRLRDRLTDGELTISTAGAAMLSGLASQYGTISSDGTLPYTVGASFLLELAGSPLIDMPFVGESGTTLRRDSRPLRWRSELTTEDRVRFRLVDHDQNPVVGIINDGKCQRRIILTRTCFYDSVPSIPSCGRSGEFEFPAVALLSAEGAAFLKTFSTELPAAFAERLHTEPLRPEAVLELGRDRNDNEICTLKVFGTSAAGVRVAAFDGTTWIDTDGATDDPFVLWDRSALDSLAPLLAETPFRWERDGRRGLLKVSKKFASQIDAWLPNIRASANVKLVGELATLGEDPIEAVARVELADSSLDWFDVRLVVDTRETKLSDGEVKALLDARGEFVRLRDHGWKRLRLDLSADERESLAKLGLSPSEMTNEPLRCHALQLADASARRLLPTAKAESIERRAKEIRARVDADVPGSIRAELRPYQVEGFRFLAYLSSNRFGGVLADDMGLGKTLQTLAWIAWLRDEGRRGGNELPPSLVVCPKSVTDGWRAEAARFAPELRVKVWSAREVESIRDRFVEADIHVVNYHQLRKASEEIGAVAWGALVLDEAQAIKTPTSVTAEVARGLRAEHRLALTGTPIENRCLDLWSIMAFAMPGVLGDRARFARLYDAKDDPLARKRLAARLRPFLLRRTKSQVATDLPPKIEEDVFSEMEGEQLVLYRAELKRAQRLVLGLKTQSQLSKMQFNVLTSILRLRQICCHPRLFNDSSVAKGAKLDALLEHLESLMEEGHKVLVFSQFVEALALIRAEIDKREWPNFLLTGDTEDRGPLVERFQSAVGPAVFLISLRAGGSGLNLTAANYVVLFDPWWNPAVETQAIDRTHRIGQAQTVIAHRFLIKDSIEEKIRLLQKRKSTIADDILGEERFSQSLTLDDVRYLFDD